MSRQTRLYGRFAIKRLYRDLPPSLIDRMRIFVDGDRIRTVTAFDTDAGWAEYAPLDDHGRRTGSLNLQRICGDVRAYVGQLTATEAQALLASGRRYELGTAHPGCRG